MVVAVISAASETRYGTYFTSTSSFLPGLEVFDHKSDCDFSLYFRNPRKHVSAKVISSDAPAVPC